jgi:hypothetical protein
MPLASVTSGLSRPVVDVGAQVRHMEARADQIPELMVMIQVRCSMERARSGSRAATKPANHLVPSKAVLHAPCLEPIDINRIGQVPRRLAS